MNNTLRATALIAALAGAAGSLTFMLRVGHRAPIFLLVMFAGWVLSPFVGFLLADRYSGHWSVPARNALFAVMLILAPASVAIYGIVAWKAPAQPAFAFLVVPAGSWFIATIAVKTAGWVSRRPTA